MCILFHKVLFQLYGDHAAQQPFWRLELEVPCPITQTSKCPSIERGDTCYFCENLPTNMGRWPNAGLLLAHRPTVNQRWANVSCLLGCPKRGLNPHERHWQLQSATYWRISLTQYTSLPITYLTGLEISFFLFKPVRYQNISTGPQKINMPVILLLRLQGLFQ